MGVFYSDCFLICNIRIVQRIRAFDFNGHMRYFICDINGGGSLKL